MGATSATGVSGGGDVGQRVGYVGSSLSQYDEHFVGIGNNNPRVIAAGTVLLDDDGGAIIPIGCWGGISASCDSGGCSWNVVLRVSVVKSYVIADADFAPLTHGFHTDDPVFTYAEYLAGSARLPLVEVIITGEAGEAVDYIISTHGKVS